MSEHKPWQNVYSGVFRKTPAGRLVLMAFHPRGALHAIALSVRRLRGLCRVLPTFTCLQEREWVRLETVSDL